MKIFNGLVLLLVSACNISINCALGDLLHTFNDPTVTISDRFGVSVAFDNNFVLVGASEDDTNGQNVGQAHLFNATTGSMIRTFNDPSVTHRDRFGRSVAIDGNLVLVGAFGDDTNDTDVGQAHLFDAITGNLLHTFDDPTPTTSDRFGESTAIEGNLILIGAGSDDTNGTNGGQAHLFDAVTGSLIHTFNDPTLGNGGSFGASVALDGNRALIGARGAEHSGTQAGEAHLFDIITKTLIRSFIEPTISQGDAFGSSVALDGNRALIGARGDDTNATDAGQAHLFDVTTGNLLHTFNDPNAARLEGFGGSVALDGDLVLIGAAGHGSPRNAVGQTHLFNAKSGKLIHTFNDPTVTFNDQFGTSVALQGNRVLIGAARDDTNGGSIGQAHLFDITNIPEPTTALLLVGMTVLSARIRVRK